MAISQELITALQANVQSLAQARFLLSTARLQAATELARAANSLIRHGTVSATLNDEMLALIYQIISGNVPEAEEAAVLTQLANKLRRANLSVPNTKAEKANLVTAAGTLLPMLNDVELDAALTQVEGQLVQLNELLAAYRAPETQPEPDEDGAPAPEE